MTRQLAGVTTIEFDRLLTTADTANDIPMNPNFPFTVHLNFLNSNFISSFGLGEIRTPSIPVAF